MWKLPEGKWLRDSLTNFGVIKKHCDVDNYGSLLVFGLNRLYQLEKVKRNLLFHERMRGQILLEGNAAGDDGFGLRPIFFDEEGEIEMADEAGDESSGEEAVKNAGEKNKIPAQAEEGKGQQIAQRLP